MFNPVPIFRKPSKHIGFAKSTRNAIGYDSSQTLHVSSYDARSRVPIARSLALVIFSAQVCIGDRYPRIVSEALHAVLVGYGSGI